MSLDVIIGVRPLPVLLSTGHTYREFTSANEYRTGFANERNQVI